MFYMTNTQAMMVAKTRNISYSSRCAVNRFPHEGTPTQQINLLTGRHEDYSLFITWKWIAEQGFTLMVTSSGQRGGGGLPGRLSPVAEAEEAEETEVDGDAGEAGTPSVTGNTRVPQFLPSFFFISLKVFLCGTNPSSTICLLQSRRPSPRRACVVRGQKQSE